MSTEEQTAAAVVSAPVAKRPDGAAHKKAVMALKADIARWQEKRATLSEEIEAKMKARERAKTRLDAVMASADKSATGSRRAEISECIAKAKELQANIKKLDEDAKKIRETAGHPGDAKRAAERLEELSYRQSSTSLSLREEQAIVREIGALKAQVARSAGVREVITQIADLRASLITEERAVQARISVLKEGFAKTDAERDELNKARDEARAAFNAARDVVNTLFAERLEVNAKVTAAYDKIKALNVQFEEGLRAWEAYQAEQAAAAEAAEAAAAALAGVSLEADASGALSATSGAARAATSAASAAVSAPVPTVSAASAALAAQADLLVVYLESLLPASPAAAPAPSVTNTATSSATLSAAAAAGLKPTSKAVSDADSFLLGGGSKGGKAAKRAGGGGKGGKASDAPAAGAGAGAAAAPAPARILPVQLSLEGMSVCTKLGIEVPCMTNEIPATLAALKAKIVELRTPVLPAAAAPKAESASASAPAATPLESHADVATSGAAAAPVSSDADADAAAAATTASAATDAAKPVLAAGAVIDTPYGPGSVSELRTDGMVVVAMSRFTATSYLQSSACTLVA